MKKKDIVIGLVILAVLAGTIYFIRKPRQRLEELPSPSIEEKIEESFNLEIPDDVDKAQLRDITGGISSGMATRIFENGEFKHMVLADLPDPVTGVFYEGWLVKDNDFFSTGKMRIAKGGWVLEFESSIDYSDYNKVVVTQELIDDENPETHILEGEF